MTCTVQEICGCGVTHTGYLLVFHSLVHASLGQPGSVVEVASCDSLQEPVRDGKVYKFRTDIQDTCQY